MANELTGKHVAFLFTEGVEQVELTKPLEAVKDAGAKPRLVSLQTGEVQMFNHLDKGDTIEADLSAAAWPSLRTDVRNAGARYVDEEVVVDNGLVSSRKPDDLPAFCAKVVEEIAEGQHEGQVASAAATASGEGAMK